MSRPPPVRLSAWRFVTTFGAVSLLADVVYEGARSITGPLLASLGATALVVGVVTGVGEAAALVLRVVSGPLADRTGRFWTWAIAGYFLTVATVPFLGVAGALWIAAALVIAERVGKAVRSPAKDTLLSHATAVTGRGRGFAVHEAMDQVGAFAGPLAVAAMLVIFDGDYGPTFALQAIPGAGVLVLLFWLRSAVPQPGLYECAAPHPEPGPARTFVRALPRSFWLYSGFSALTMTGFATFGVLSFHQVTSGVVAVAAVPVIYAAAMAADAVAALVLGWRYDRVGPRVLGWLPVLAALVPLLAFGAHIAMVVAGALLWGAAVGIQESTLRAVVADLVEPGRRATAYGIYAAVIGAAAAVGGALTGFLYSQSVTALVVVVAGIQILALGFLPVVWRAARGHRR
ncbi:MFS transporter [Mycolicibacterium duvalii]|uniref:Major facilitator superfamily protein n=1 Tax=Mycolicibacterium duvalii TaxID=39688 RepID=A0A7I7JZG1_9MYCO|nr:MFS transporter [Mycolicibacterium duvalii]MCV7366819.1 MFS transporter [Mycolicibacterium duvalii]PEG43946.1 MFS transporter [Mycolicibacterium duvalii]BBX16718.1 major facilitator superfamily protein [Mycolicibacterium duvalii]